MDHHNNFQNNSTKPIKETNITWIRKQQLCKRNMQLHRLHDVAAPLHFKTFLPKNENKTIVFVSIHNNMHT